MICAHCKEDKFPDQYYTKRAGHRDWCITCHRTYRNAWARKDYRAEHRPCAHCGLLFVATLPTQSCCHRRRCRAASAGVKGIIPVDVDEMAMPV